MNEHIRNIAKRLEQDFGWEHKCAEAFATFLAETNENDCICTPELYSQWCHFVVLTYDTPQGNRPEDIDIVVVLEELLGWCHNGKAIKYLISELHKGYLLLNHYRFYTQQK